MAAEDITVRMGVNPDEIDGLYEMERRIYSRDMMWPKREFRAMALKGHAWIAENGDGVPVALMIVGLHRGVPHIDTIEVVHEARGIGIAGRLMDMGEEEFRERGYGEMRLEVGSDNPAADIYLRRGYAVVKTMKNYYSDGHDALVMSKPL